MAKKDVFFDIFELKQPKNTFSKALFYIVHCNVLSTFTGTAHDFSVYLIKQMWFYEAKQRTAGPQKRIFLTTLETKYAKNDRRYPSNIENITIICKKMAKYSTFWPKNITFWQYWDKIWWKLPPLSFENLNIQCVI